MGESIAEKSQNLGGPPGAGRSGDAAGLTVLYQDHARRWRENIYVYAVISRRSGGLSIGINLNPDTACNFDCIYCQVDRRQPPRTRVVDLNALARELDDMLALATSGELFAQPPYDSVPPDKRKICDIAFSGDGEPTTYPLFADAVRIAARGRLKFGLHDAKLVLITDACYLTRDHVREGLRVLDENNGEIWAKLDAGTEAYYRLVNRPNYPLTHVIENIVSAARCRPVVIQSLWMRVHGQAPPPAEIDAFGNRLNEIMAAGGVIKLVQLYTIARQTAEPYAQPLSDAEMDGLAARVHARVAVPTATYYGIA